VAALAGRLGDAAYAERQILRLAELGVLDLVDSPLSTPVSGQPQQQRIMR
jgi:hypothetical protein